MYNHGEIDKKWQDRWLKSGAFKAEDFSEKPKKYLLVEFPFPSGAGLHVGHPRSYVALDVMARKYRQEGNNVLYPMGWDAFGLPTENYAIKTGRPPAEVTAENIATFKAQIQSLGLSFDWDREVNSTDPGYYKWTQWQFLQFFKAGLAYKAKTMINWCPKDKIGLANEEAAGGVCDRCGGPVEKREKEQWMIGITKYADRLLSDLNTVDYLPRIRKQQEEWIGRSEGAEVNFLLDFKKDPSANDNRGSNGERAAIKVFTTRPDTIFGATYLVLAPEHIWVTLATDDAHDVLENKDEVRAYVESVKNRTEIERTSEGKEKTGVELKGIKAINPATGEEIPMFVADYVLPHYGTGAIMAVPAHDERDFEFAKKFALPIKQVVAEQIGERLPDALHRSAARAICIKDGNVLFAFEKTMQEYVLPGGGIDAGETPEEAVLREIVEETGYKNARIVKSLGTVERNYHHTYKKNNWHSFDTGFVVELIDEQQVPVTQEEADKHELHWAPFAEAYEKIKSSSTFGTSSVFFDRISNNCGVLFVGEGVSINSGFLNGLTTTEAKQKMLARLEENKVGARKVTYKLRDWVFSRQRYWGEPIPLVHCEQCEQKKQKVLMVHGFSADGNGLWFPYVKNKLEALGFDVTNPTIKDAAHPSVDGWNRDIIPHLNEMGEDDVVVAHSIGATAVLHAIVTAKKKIGHLILVAPAIGPVTPEQWAAKKAERPDADIDGLRSLWEAPIDLKEIDQYVGSVQVIFSADDSRVPVVGHELCPTGWYVNKLNGFGHFFGTEIPELVEIISATKKTGWNPLPDSELPLKLPEVDKYEPTDNGESPLASIPEWVNVKCPRCGSDAKRETDTMPNWAGSSWYFLRYIDAHNDKEFAAADKLKYWMPVDLYNGGMEHTTLHLLYSRFWNKFMYDLGYVPTAEPYARRVSHGLIMAEDGTKMSKSKGNVVNPDEIVQAQGADTLRMYELFIGPFSEPAPWSTNGVSGVRRFLDRVMRLPGLVMDTEPENVTRGLHKAIKKVTEDIERMSFNTAVAEFMTFVNTAYGAAAITKETLKTFLTLLSSFAPHVSEELWSQLGGGGMVCQQPWPQYNAALTVDEFFELVVQVNGKVRDKIQVAGGTEEDTLKKLALASEKVQQWLEGKEPQKIVVVKNKIVSIVV